MKQRDKKKTNCKTEPRHKKKPVFGVCDQLRHKPACVAKEELDPKF